MAVETAKSEWAEKLAALKSQAEEQTSVLKKISDAIVVSRKMYTIRIP